MIALSTPVFDLSGHLVLWELPSTALGETSRRATRLATLDGGVVVNDFGYAVGDRTIEVKWNITNEAQYRDVERLVKSYPQIKVSTRDGFFAAVPKAVSRNQKEGSLTLLVVA